MEILKLKSILYEDFQDSNRIVKQCANFVCALTLGILHGDRPESLSIPMDSAKAISVNHIRQMQSLYPEKYKPSRYRSVLHSLISKLAKVFNDPIPRFSGKVYSKDALDFEPRYEFKMIITSPPYINVHTYAYDNRIRLWFLGRDYKEVHKKLFATEDLNRYLDCLVRCLKQMESHLGTPAACFLVLGDVKKNNDIVQLGELLAKRWIETSNTELRLHRIIVDPTTPGRRRYFNLGARRGVTIERILEFHKGRVVEKNVNIDWKTRPWASLEL